VTARLVELNPGNTRLAREQARAAVPENIEVVAADAAITDAYAGAVPADVLVLCGVFGNITAEDITRTITHLPPLCARVRVSSGRAIVIGPT
jgi:hypothetical protein